MCVFVVIIQLIKIFYNQAIDIKRNLLRSLGVVDVYNVHINTGSFIKSLRFEHESAIGRVISGWAANHFSFVQFLARSGLTLGKATEKILGRYALKGITRYLNKIG